MCFKSLYFIEMIFFFRKIKFFDVQNHVAIWNKKQIRVYELICDASKSDEEKVVRNEKGKEFEFIK